MIQSADATGTVTSTGIFIIVSIAVVACKARYGSSSSGDGGSCKEVDVVVRSSNSDNAVGKRLFHNQRQSGPPKRKATTPHRQSSMAQVVAVGERNMDKNSILPAHVQRQIYKDERLEKLRSQLTMKRPMYDNIIMQCPKGNILSTISMKKAKWYISKGLAVWIYNDTGSSTLNDTTATTDNPTPSGAIRLLFAPSISKSSSSSSSSVSTTRRNDKSSDSTSSQTTTTTTTTTATTAVVNYNASTKYNRCVICGAEHDGYMRHYIVPYCYRAHFPSHYKTHLPHDIVLVCPRCHGNAVRQSHYKMKQLEDTLRYKQQHLHPTSNQVECINHTIAAVQSAATALLNYREKIPPLKILQYETLLQNWILQSEQQEERPSSTTMEEDHTSAIVSLTQSQLVEMSQLVYRYPNPHYVAGTELVINSLTTTTMATTPKCDNPSETAADKAFDDIALERFVRDWRSHFITCHNPRYLPHGWSIDAAVRSDR